MGDQVGSGPMQCTSVTNAQYHKLRITVPLVGEVLLKRSHQRLRRVNSSLDLWKASHKTHQVPFVTAIQRDNVGEG